MGLFLRVLTIYVLRKNLKNITIFHLKIFTGSEKLLCYRNEIFGGPSWQRWAPKLVHLSPYEPVPNILRFNFNKELTADFISSLQFDGNTNGELINIALNLRIL